MSNETFIHLVRHGEVLNPHGLLYGRLPGFRLTPSGRNQARAAGRAMSNNQIQAIYSSPLLRARQTADAMLLENPRADRHISQYLDEVLSPYDGWSGEWLDARQGDIYSSAGPEFEQPGDIVHRMKKFFRRIFARHSGGSIAAVTHGDVITFTVLWANGFELSPKNKLRLRRTGYPVSYPAHASITSLTFHANDPEEKPAITYFRPW
jgi:broad specificity phosphatase PhoE